MGAKCRYPKLGGQVMHAKCSTFPLTLIGPLCDRRSLNVFTFCISFIQLNWSLFQLDKGYKNLYEMKLAHQQYSQLLSRMCKAIPQLNCKQRTNGVISEALFPAIEQGSYEFVYQMLEENKDLLWSVDASKRNIFGFAVLNRQPKIFNLIFYSKNILLSGVDVCGNNILHLAGTLETSTSVNQVRGAALQMQTELQWFKVSSFELYTFISKVLVLFIVCMKSLS